MSSIGEISLRTVGGCYITIGGENIPLRESITEEESEALYHTLTDGALYTHEDTVAEGFVTLVGGIRVGICGEVRYNGGVSHRVGTPHGFVFRIPTSHPSFSYELYDMWQKRGRCGILVFSPPGGGKTTLIRAFAARISESSGAIKCVIIDQRREFIPEDYSGGCIDILRGYDKIKGIEIAQRTLSPELIIIDELSGEGQARALRECGRGGVCLVATVHAGSAVELITNENIKRLLDDGYFGILAELHREGGRFDMKLHEVGVLCGSGALA